MLLGRFSESNRAVCIILDVDFQKTGRCSPVAGVYEREKWRTRRRLSL
jgi:hypothetical protein